MSSSSTRTPAPEYLSPREYLALGAFPTDDRAAARAAYLIMRRRHRWEVAYRWAVLVLLAAILITLHILDLEVVVL